MPAPFFTSNDSDLVLEGLYIKERQPPAVISGVPLNTVGVCGTAVRGPTDHAVLIGSLSRLEEVFGGRDLGSGGAIYSNIWKALANKPFSTLKVVRVAAAAAAAADHTFSDAVPTAICRIAATSVGVWGNGVQIDIQNATDAVANHFNLVVSYNGKSVTYKNLDLSGTNDNSVQVLGTDDGNLVKITKLAPGRPLNVAAILLGSGGGTAGADGAIADTDYTATGGALDILAADKDCAVVFVAEHMSATVRSKMSTLAAGASDRLFLIGPDSATVAASAAPTDIAAISSDRVLYCFNDPYTIDPASGTEMVTAATGWMAAVLANTDVDIHPGEEDTKKFTAAITRLSFPALSRSDYISLREAGICALEQDGGFAFVSGVTTSLVPGKEQITRRRMTDFLQLSIAKTLKYSVKKKNTFTRKQANAAMIQQFLDDLQRAERVVLASQVDPDVLNTDAQEAQGIVRILVRVKLIGHILELVLETEIGTTVTVLQQ